MQEFQTKRINPEYVEMSKLFQRLTTCKDSEIRAPILTKLEPDQNLNLQAVAEKRVSMINLRHDANKIEEKDYSHIRSCQLVTDKEN